HYPRNPQQPGKHAGIPERAWMAGVASNIGKFHVQQAKRLRAETAQKKKKKKKKKNVRYVSDTHSGIHIFKF
ncbi:jg24930, partial [Pararge aegeria aegeria]